jgi:cytochrome c oxidase subunit 3
MEQQREAGSIGMWVFLVTEIMFFGGLFFAYALYRSKFPDAFTAASKHLNVWLGGFNTGVLILSSLTMALAVYYAQTGVRGKQIRYLIVTMILGLTFLGVKVVEYKDKYDNHLFPGKLLPWNPFHWHQQLGAGVSEKNIEMFYWIYFGMTGLHALHMVIGIGCLGFLTWFAYKGRYSPEYHAPVELTGLYWHFVDIVWIFLFPLLYLLGFHLGH